MSTAPVPEPSVLLAQLLYNVTSVGGQGYHTDPVQNFALGAPET